MKTDYIALHQEPDKDAAKQDGGDKTPPVNTNTKTKEDLNMAKEQIIKSFIENDKLTFNEDDREWLESLSEEQLVKMQVNYHALEAKDPEPKDDGDLADGDDGTPAVNADAGTPEPKDEPKPKTPEEFISSAPVEMQEVLTNGLKMFRDKKSKLVKGLLANKRNKFTEEQLKARSLEELENLVELSAVEVDFSTNAQPRHKEPKINERNEDGLGIPDPPTPVWINGRPDFSHLNS